ncbi:MAG: sensor histidine kinase [Planctomycetaceae bacterium]
MTTFRPPPVLIQVSSRLTQRDLLFDQPTVHDVNAQRDPGFTIRLEGDFDVGEEHWSAVAEVADWILEIKADNARQRVSYLITPTKSFLKDHPKAEQHDFEWDSPQLDYIPSFHARILIRDGREDLSAHQRAWFTRSAGVRIYMEGFRVLPYGDTGDDWLELDFDYSRRQRSLRFLSNAPFDLQRFGATDQDFGLHTRRNTSYFGAVFLTMRGAAELNMLVNREGFIPNAAFLSLKHIVRTGIDLSVRVKAYETGADRQKWRDQRSTERTSAVPERMKLREAAEQSVTQAKELAQQARVAAAAGDVRKAERLIESAGKEIVQSTSLAGELVSDRSILQILAGVGLQMAAFVHEMNALLGMASAVEASLISLKVSATLGPDGRKQLAKLSQSMGDLRRVVERQASYLKDVTSPDSRRRRSRQRLHDRFDAALKLVARAADKRNITIANAIPQEIKSPPMFPAELTVVFSNLLSNAIKACRRNGDIQAKARTLSSGVVELTIQNTGARVNLRDAEKWFLPFRSTTVEADPVLGQGMGMGLPIVRNILEEYGATICFTTPTGAFSTSVKIAFP